MYRCFYANARHLQAKMGELVLKENLDKVVITETWWNGENQWDMVISKYKHNRKDKEGHSGGGVALYIKEGIVLSRLEHLNGSDSYTEMLWVAIQAPKTNVVLGTCYCPPAQKAQVDLEMENKISEAPKR